MLPADPTILDWTDGRGLSQRPDGGSRFLQCPRCQAVTDTWNLGPARVGWLDWLLGIHAVCPTPQALTHWLDAARRPEEQTLAGLLARWHRINDARRCGESAWATFRSDLRSQALVARRLATFVLPCVAAAVVGLGFVLPTAAGIAPIWDKLLLPSLSALALVTVAFLSIAPLIGVLTARLLRPQVPSELAREAADALRARLDPADDRERLVLAELLRQGGELARASLELERPVAEDWEPWRARLIELVEAGDRELRRLDPEMPLPSACLDAARRDWGQRLPVVARRLAEFDAELGWRPPPRREGAT